MDFRNLHSRLSTARKKSQFRTQAEIMDRLTPSSGDFNLAYLKSDGRVSSSFLWQILFVHDSKMNDPQRFEVRLKHLLYGTIIGPLVMHIIEHEPGKAHLRVKFATPGGNKFVNIDG